jgi:hypothetical protein
VIASLLRQVEVRSEQQLRADLLGKPFEEMTPSEREMLRKLVMVGRQR